MSETVIDVAGAIERHFETMDSRIYGRVMTLADQIGEMATSGFVSTQPESITHMPAALLDEDKLGMALDALRDDAEPPYDSRWLLVSGNTTGRGSQDPRAVKNLEPVMDYMTNRPQFPLSAYLELYRPGTPIGTVRADLNDAGVEVYRRHCQVTGVPPKDIMMVNCDADTRQILALQGGPYLSQVEQARRRSRAAYLEVYPRVMHAEIDDERFPRMHRLITWRDYMSALFEFSYPAHYAVNLYGYLDSGGFDRACDNSEQLQLGRAMSDRAATTGQKIERIGLPGVTALVSPRRYALELMNGQHMGYGPLCVPGEGQLVHEAPGTFRDVSVQEFKREVGYEVLRACRRGLDKFVVDFQREHPEADRGSALDHAFERVCKLIQEERTDAPNIDGINSRVLSALAQFGEEVEDMKAAGA